MNVTCSAEPCPILLNASCVFYTGGNLVYTGIVTNDNLETAIQKIDAKFQDAGLGYIFNNGIIQSVPGDPVQLGGVLIQNTTIASGGFNLTFTGELYSNKFVTIGGTSSQFVKGDGSLDSTSYQPSGSYITALTGDGTASGPGSAVFTLAPVSALFAGTWGSATTVPQFTIDSKGRVLSVINVPINLPSPFATFIGDVFGGGSLAGNITLTISNVLGSPGTYGSGTQIPVITVNSKGQVTNISQVPITGGGGSGTVTNVSVTAGTGISASVTNPTTTPNITITNTAPDQTVVLNSGTGISTSGTYPNFTITNSAPDQIVSIGTTGSGLSVTGSYPSFTLQNTLPDQTVALTSGTGISISGTYPNFTITNTSPSSGGTVTSIATSAPITGGTITTTGTIGITQATALTDGYLSSVDWTTFNNKQSAISLTTTGTSGAATFIANTLNIPQYQAALTNPVTGTGTTNYVPKFTGTSAIGNSQIFDNGTSVGINTASPAASSLLDMTSTARGLLIPRMTTAQINAIASPAQGLMAFDTSYNSLVYYDTNFGDWWSDSQYWLAYNGFSVFDDFMTYSYVTNYNGQVFQIQNANSATWNNVTPLGNRPGVLQISTGVNAAGRITVQGDGIQLSSFIVGGGKLVYETDVQIQTLSDGTNTFRFFTGFSSSSTLPTVNSIMFLYDASGISTGSAATPNWQVVCSVNPTRTFTTTSTAVVAGTWYRLKIEINAAGNSVGFYINGVLAATIATNIPTGALTPVTTLFKSAGTTARTAWLDFIRIRQKFTTPR